MAKMTKTKTTQILLSLLFVTQVTSTAKAADVPTIKIDGSSTVFPITEAMAEEYQTSKKGAVRVTVGISGTGGGFKKFCRGETDVQNASRPISSAKKDDQPSEMDNCNAANIKFFELPIAYDATAIVVNPANTWLSSITVEELKKIWEPSAEGKIMKWNQVNPNWPDAPIKLYGAGSDSGTFDYFTEAIVGKAKASRGDYNASEDDNTLVQGVSKDKNALGYMPLAYYESNKSKLKIVGLKGGDKAPKRNEAIVPSRKSVEDGTYFPLSRPIFIYVSETASKRPEVMEFASFYLKNAGRLVPEVKYVPLPTTAYTAVQKHLEKKQSGTIFGGHSEIGMSIEKLLKKEKL